MVSENVWGKTLKIEGKGEIYPLIGHLYDTATVAGILWDEWLKCSLKTYLNRGFQGNGKAALQLAAGLHDLGKCSPIFQGALLAKHPQKPRNDLAEPLSREGFVFPELEKALRSNLFHRHEKLGFYSLAPEVGPGSPSTNNWLPLSTLGHHGSFLLDYGKKNIEKLQLEKIFTEDWLLEQKSIFSLIEGAVGLSYDNAKTYELDPISIILVAGLTILADRIASTEDSQIDGFYKLRDESLNLTEGREWLNKRKPYLRYLVDRELGLNFHLSSDSILGNHSPRGVQKQVPTSDDLWLCMAPTGAGKTEAALLRHSQRDERLLFLLPTMATTNAMMNRVIGLYGKDRKTAVLGHGHAFLDDFYNSLREKEEDCGLTPTRFSSVPGAKLSAAVNVATIDQLLTAGLPQKWTHLRWLLLLNSHIVIDEAHLLDRYQLKLLEPLLILAGLLKTRVTILSATLPTWLQKRLTNAYGNELFSTVFPASITTDKGSDPEVPEAEKYSATLEVSGVADLADAHVSWAEKTLAVHPDARLGIFVNQVARAQAIASELELKFPDVKVLCLHSRLMAGHRRAVTAELLRAVGTRNGEATRFIVVGSQAIEMSLDIDLDFISTDLCPAPSLIQRMGRVWRDKKADRSRRTSAKEMNTAIIYPKDETGKIAYDELLPYGEAVLLRTLEHIQGKEKLIFPDELQAFVETVYLSKEEDLTKSELQERTEEIFRELKSSSLAVETEPLLTDYWDEPSVRTFQGITKGRLDEQAATRLIEGIYTEPFILCSDDPLLRSYGALPVGTDPKAVKFKDAIAATIAISLRQAKELETSVERLAVGDKLYGFFGELPENFVYEPLVGVLG